MKYLIGAKIGMSRVFNEEGNNIAVTLVSALPADIIKQKTVKVDGYNAICAKVVKSKQDKEEKDQKCIITEFNTTEVEMPKVGDKLLVDQFKVNDKVVVAGKSKGKGFSGVIKRHGFHRGPKTHGSDHHRAVGSIGGAFPQRVVKGRKMPGRVGTNNVTIKNLRVLNIDTKNGVLAISGAIPGPKRSIIKIMGE